MNLTCFIDHLPILKDAVLTLSAIIASIVAINGLSIWKKQLKGAVEYDLARRLLKSTYRLRDAIKGVRNPVMWNHEIPSPTEEEAKIMDFDEKRHYGTAKAYEIRWEKVRDVRVELQPDLLEAEALWGKDIYEKFNLLFKLEVELSININNYLRLCNPKTDQPSKDAITKIMKNKRDILYDETDKDNPDDFMKDITEAINGIEEYIKPHLQK